MKRKIPKDKKSKNFPIVADMLGVWEEYSDETDPNDVLGSYTGSSNDDDLYPEQDADDL